MSDMKILKLIFLFLLFTHGSAFSQRPDTLPKDPVALWDFINRSVGALNNKDLTLKYNAFSQLFQSSAYSDIQKKLIYQTVGSMWERKLSLFPYINSYLAFVEILKVKATSEEHFISWHKSFQRLLSLPEIYTPFKMADFISISTLFYEQQLISNGSGANWILRGGNPVWLWENQEPKLSFNNVTLVTGYKTDTIHIIETSGVLIPFKNQWIGTGGKCDWSRVGLEKNIFVLLKHYNLDLKINKINADSVQLSYPNYFGKNLVLGNFQDQMVYQPDSTLISYPRFNSLRENLVINQFGEGIKFRGGFALEGKSIVGFGSADNPATITLVNNKARIAFVGASEKFVLKRLDQLSSQKVKSALFLGADSIVHPELIFNYNTRTRTLLLRRGDKGKGRNLFYSSAHQFSIQAEELVMQIDNDSVMIGREALPILKKPAVRFESLNYFNENEFENLKGISTQNPLVLLHQISQQKQTTIFDARTLAPLINPKYTLENIRSLLYEWVSAGFISFQEEKNQVIVNEKVKLTVEAADGKRDFDRLRIDSKTDGVNAWLTLFDKNIKIQAVNFLDFSPLHRVRLIPSENKINLLPERVMRFSGVLKAGFTDFEGSGFEYNYKQHQIKLDSVKQFRIFLKEPETDATKIPAAFSLTSEINSFSGVLAIDAPENKGGRENISSFPVLNSKTGGTIFYDGAFAKDTTLKRDSFYFSLDPFIFSGLDKFQENQVQFKGRLFSYGIFPVFKEIVKIRPSDYSLGFIHLSPKEGYVAYRNKGRYSGEIDLSNKGLKGKGRLDYLGAVINAEDFVFQPDKVAASAKVFSLEEELKPLEIPKVLGKEVTVTWKPYHDSLYLTSGAQSFNIFKSGNYIFDGSLVLTPKGVGGNGILNWPQASLKAEKIGFGASTAKSDTSWLKIKGKSENELLLEALNVSSNLNFDKGFGSFDGNDEKLLTNLPFNQYTTSLIDFDWNIKEQMVYFRSDSSSYGLFSSKVANQDSLRFLGRNASYNLKDFSLEIGGVNFINAADAKIMPDKGKINVRANGIIDSFTNAVIICDTINQNHKIIKANVQIKGRKDYVASGFYEYNLPGKNQEIAFSSIIGQRVGKGLMSQKATATRAQGEIDASDDFRIDTKTSFYGKIGLASEDVNLTFDGYAKLESSAMEENSWFRLNTKADKNNLVIEANRPKDPEGLFLETGFFLSAENSTIYPRFLQPLPVRKDRPVFPANGFVRYDRLKDQFLFGDSLCVSRGTCLGNLLVLDDKTAKVTAEGDFNLASGLKMADVKATGFLKTTIPPSQEMADTGEVQKLVLDLDIILGLNLKIPEKFLRIMENEMASAAFGSEPVTYLSDLDYYNRLLTRVLGNSEETKEVLSQLSSGLFEIPAKLNPYSFLFGNVKLKWDSEYQAFINSNTNLGLISLGGKPVSKKINTFVELRMPANNDDRIYVYIKLPNDIYYYFGLRKGFLEMNSNDSRFQDELMKTKKPDLLLKMPGGEVLEIQPVESNRAQMFMRRAMSAGK
jgi:hypothetical protein